MTKQQENGEKRLAAIALATEAKTINLSAIAAEVDATPTSVRRWLLAAGFDLSGLRRGRPKA